MSDAPSSEDKINRPDIGVRIPPSGAPTQTHVEGHGGSGVPGRTHVEDPADSVGSGWTQVEGAAGSGAPGRTYIEGGESGDFPNGNGDSPEGRSEPDFYRLPAALAGDYAIVGELPAGGQAALLLCRRKAAIEAKPIVVKLFHARPSRVQDDRVQAAELRRRLDELASPHVVKVERWGESSTGRIWQVMSYYPLGSLKDHLEQTKAPASKEFVRAILIQVAGLLEEIHSGTPTIVHRDIKPGNILLRSLDPVDCVLTDFGLAAALSMSVEMRSGSHTLEYAAPEAPHGKVSSPLDWWGLGMTLAELLLGYHPLVGPGGSPPSAGEIAASLDTRSVPLDDVEDRRWHQLLRGLLTRDPARRWGSNEVQDWLDGGFPDVVVDRDEETSPHLRAFQFAGRQIVGLSSMGASMAANWDASRRLIMGSAFDELLEWADRLDSTGGVAAVHAAFTSKRLSPDATVAALIAAMAPRLAPTFRGTELSPSYLAGLYGADAVVAGDDSTIVNQLFESQVMAGYPGLKDWDEQWRSVTEEVGRLASGFLPAAHNWHDLALRARPRLLAGIISKSTRDRIFDDGHNAIQNRIAREQPWFEVLCQLAEAQASMAKYYVVGATANAAQDLAIKARDLAIKARAEASRLAAELEQLTSEILNDLDGLAARYQAAVDAEKKALAEFGTDLLGDMGPRLKPLTAQEPRIAVVKTLSSLIPHAASRLQDLAETCLRTSENRKAAADRAVAQLLTPAIFPPEPWSYLPSRPRPSAEASSYRTSVGFAWIGGLVGLISWTAMLWPSGIQGGLAITLLLFGIAGPITMWFALSSRGEDGRKSVADEKSELAKYKKDTDEYQEKLAAYLHGKEKWELGESKRMEHLVAARDVQRREQRTYAGLQKTAQHLSLVAEQLRDEGLLADLKRVIRDLGR